MCGICGVTHYDPAHRAAAAPVEAMCARLAHRGPDGQAVAALGQAALGHRRLVVIDPDTGAQPMFNEDRSIALVFNGEIYNFRELRRRLEAQGHRFASDHSDTETIIHLYEERGIDCVQDLRGMFAFALWDAGRRRLMLARDRVGKKPLYWAEHGGALWFASELKALLAVENLPRQVNPEAIDDFLTYQYVPPPQTIYRGMRKLPPAHVLVWEGGQPRIERYWRLAYEPKAAISRGVAVEKAGALIDEAVRLRLESDVPLGCFLSGGVDSSLVVAMMRRHVTGPLRTFSIGFEESGFNELPYAREVARRFETEHVEFVVRADAAQLLPKLAWHFDEPYADMSAVPAFCLAEQARRQVTVALNGDGGDESFAGYERYRGLRVYRQWARVPVAVRKRLVGPLARMAGRLFPESAVLEDVRCVNEVSLESPARRYAAMMTIFREAAKARLFTEQFAREVAPHHAPDWLARHFERPDVREEIDRKMACDVETYLPGDLLPKVDRTAMAVGLEGRSPLLDQAVMEFAAALPGALKFPGGRLKALLKEVAAPVLGRAFVERPKHGFSTPVGAWFRGPLRPLMRELLLSEQSARRGLFRPRAVERLVAQHDAGRARHHHRLWALMCLEMWFRVFEDGESP